MKAKLFLNNVRVQKSPIHGYGVFAQTDIQKGEIVEECIAFNVSDGIKDFINYTFKIEKKALIFSGYGCIYNHADKPNANWTFDSKRKVLVITANQLIPANNEIFISYGSHWFSSRNWEPKRNTFLRVFFYPITRKIFKGSLVISIFYGLLFFLKNLIPIFATYLK